MSRLPCSGGDQADGLSPCPDAPKLPGPVFNVELITTARRARYYVLRTLYGAILLFVLWQNYQSWFWWGRSAREISIREMAQFAQGLFYSFAITQAVAIALITPVMLAGVIADEKQRRTLHYLMASRLSSAEVVLGKLLARMLHVGVFLGVGLPILSLLTLFGGIDPGLLGVAYLLTATGSIFLAGLSILVSTYARTVREAIIVVFLLAGAWLVLPPLLTDPLLDTWPALHALVDPVNDWVLATSPFSLIPGMGAYAPGTPTERMVAWLASLQVGCAAAFVALSIARLRPVFRTQSGESRRGAGWWSRLGRPWRLAPRPALGDRPMLWKELHVVRSGGIVRWVVRLLAAIGLVLLVYWTLSLGLDAAAEAWRGSPGTGSRGYFNPIAGFNAYLRTVTGCLYVLWVLGVTVNACASVTAEKEEDTWLSLVGTPLSGSEILIPKMLGAAWSMRALGVTMLVLWLLGVATTAVHPLGLLAVLVECGVFTWFAAALGTILSLHARNTTRATVAAVAILVLTNGGYLLCCIPLQPDTMMVTLGCTPFIVVASLFSGDEFRNLVGIEAFGYPGSQWMTEVFLTCLLGTLAYLTAAILLSSASIGGFDEAVDRPRRGPIGPQPPLKTARGKSPPLDRGGVGD